MFERVRLTVMDLEAALHVVSAGSTTGSADDFERAVVVVTEAAARVRDMETRAQQIIDGYMPGSTGDQVARYILGVH
jgi:hypothetical protein